MKRSQRVRLHRRPSIYLYAIALPNFLLVTLGFLALRVDHTQVNDRVQIVLTLLLASIGYRHIVGDLLPHTSTISWLESYLLLCIAVEHVQLGPDHHQRFWTTIPCG